MQKIIETAPVEITITTTIAGLAYGAVLAAVFKCRAYEYALIYGRFLDFLGTEWLHSPLGSLTPFAVDCTNSKP